MSRLPDASAWTLDPDLAYLNHGGFAAAPTVVQAEQQRWRDAMERNPFAFLTRQLPGLLDAVRDQVAEFLGADADGLVFTDNATTGTQTVIAQISRAGLRPGDELLTTDHCYPAVLGQLRRAADATGAVLRVAPVPLPATSAAGVAQAVLAGLSARTRLVVVDHVGSCSGLVFPVEEIVVQCRRLGVPVLVDGAHATGMLPVDLGRLDADFWVGNLHKWVSAPKGVAVLHTAARWRAELHPLVTSHGAFDGYQPSFDWTGTRDPSALLSVPAALAFFDQAGWEATRQHNNDLARRGATLVTGRVGTDSPDHPGELGAAMRPVRLPAALDQHDALALEDRLLERYRVVVPVTHHGGSRFCRVSAQLYNTLADFERLGDALADLSRRVPF